MSNSTNNTLLNRSLFPFAAVAIALLLIGLHPRNVDLDEQSGSRFLKEDVGYKAAVDRMSQLGLFEVRTLPSGRGLPSRSTVAINEDAFAKAELDGVLCARSSQSLLSNIWAGLKSLASNSDDDVSECRQLLSAYRKATFLEQDMVRASRQTWLIRGTNITGIRRQSHVLRESGFDPSSADFKITYSSRRNRTKTPWALVDPVNLDSTVLRRTGDRPRCDTGLIPDGFSIFCYRGGVILAYPQGASPWQVYKNGQRQAQQGRAGQPWLMPLTKGDTIAFAKGLTAPKKVLQLLPRRQSLSEVSGGIRVRDPAFAGLSSQIDAHLTMDLKSSINQDLQAAIQEELETALIGTPSRAGSSLRGAILLMDGLTGQVAAGATFPKSPEHLLAKEREQPSRQIWLEQNQAFEALPIGSTAKIPFAAAITSADPSLLKVTLLSSPTVSYSPYRFLQNGSFTRSTVGSNGVLLQGSNLKNVNFRAAIARSDNLYAVKLIREAWHTNRSAPQSADWLHNLDVLTCAAPRPGNTDYGCPIHLWADVTAKNRGGPHRSVVFDFEKSKVEASPHNQLFYGPLGNGSYNWSLAQLTQSYARFMSGKLVSATISERGNSWGSTADHLRGGGYESSWSAVMRGMRDVIADSSIGTAKSISDLEAKLGDNVYLYAKTGTPTVGYRKGADGSVIVLAAIKTNHDRPPTRLSDQDNICSMRFLSINLQYKTPQLAVVRRLLETNEAVRDWMTGGC